MCRRENEAGRRLLCDGLAELGIETYAGEANFVLSRVGDGAAVFQALQARGVIVRPLDAVWYGGLCEDHDWQG